MVGKVEDPTLAGEEKELGGVCGGKLLKNGGIKGQYKVLMGIFKELWIKWHEYLQFKLLAGIFFHSFLSLQ